MKKSITLAREPALFTWNNVNSHIWSRDVCVASSGRRYRCLAATVVEKLDVCVPEMSICHAVDHIVEAGLWKSNPCCHVECLVSDISRRCWDWKRKNYNEGKPEDDKREKTVEVTAYEWKVRLVRHAWLKAWLTHELFCIDDDPNVDEECDEKRSQN